MRTASSNLLREESQSLATESELPGIKRGAREEEEKLSIHLERLLARKCIKGRPARQASQQLGKPASRTIDAAVIEE